MKSKKTIYLLLPLVLGIWGLVGYRIYRMTRTDIGSFDNLKKNALVSDSVQYQKQIPLKLNYPDPFLKEAEVASEEKLQNEFASLFSTNPQPEKKLVTWPTIAFKGMVNSGNEGLGILEVEKKRQLMSVGESFGEYQIVGLYADSIVIAFNNETKTFFK
ncbi:MAG: hypothetical protein A2W97_06805 [Bacteroidetes bacterium GWE2_40_63]|nr:MAG: hypothetical protein A2W84_01765 [Bacteroidetes bacterium GWC2_40_13]OFX70893.1 MAG: hypothetical protein A2W96_14065 [Bacteroidetes bacterium GWD2_40_43]OFX95693.1 MAG: hypothetical protein A2W97_06805 [Bacteroidetes bacterium GWE2_40_63]OFY21232.1 MAG: hypothetical protein A2W88_19385 [Bacteroidetes bacterium GWF2_40_13]